MRHIAASAPRDNSHADYVDPRTGEILPGGADRLSYQLSLIASGNKSAKRSAIRSYRLKVQRMARSALIGRPNAKGRRFRTCDCLRSARGGVEDVTVCQSRETGAAAYRGLQTCGSVWTCPVCASKVAGSRRDEVRSAIDAHLATGGVVLAVTFTLRHGVSHSARELLDGLTPALKRLRANRAVKELRDAAGFVGSIKALEVTYGDANGWHPHIHELWFLDAPAVMVPIWHGIVSQAWIAAVKSSGLPAPSADRGCMVKVVHEARDYEAKGNSSIDGVDGWDAADELTRSIAKGGHYGRFSPFDLLVDGRVELFREFAVAFTGKRQLTWSPGLKGHFSIGERSDEELAADESDNGAPVLRIPRTDWAKLIRAADALDYRVSVLELVEGPGGARAARDFLLRLGLRSTVVDPPPDIAST